METKLESQLRKLMSNLESEIKLGTPLTPETILLMSEIKQDIMEDDARITTQLKVLETWRM